MGCLAVGEIPKLAKMNMSFNWGGGRYARVTESSQQEKT